MVFDSFSKSRVYCFPRRILLGKSYLDGNRLFLNISLYLNFNCNDWNHDYTWIFQQRLERFHYKQDRKIDEMVRKNLSKIYFKVIKLCDNLDNK